MFSDVLTEDDARNYLTPYHSRLMEAVTEGFSILQSVYNEIPKLPIRTRADIIRSGVMQYFRKSDIPVYENETKDYFFIVINNSVLLRPKKLDDTYHANFNCTSSSQDFLNSQMCLEGFSNPFKSLILGYVPDPTWAKSKGVFIAEPQGLWAYNVTSTSDTNKILQQSLPSNEPVIRIKGFMNKAAGNNEK